MNPSPHIHTATIADIKKIIALKIDINQSGDQLHPAEKTIQELFIHEFEKRWKTQLKNGWQFLLISLEDKVFGFISYSMNIQNQTAHINNLYIITDKRRQQCGTQLVEAMIKNLRQNHIKEVTVWITECNDQGMLFYEKQGFTATSVIREEKNPSHIELNEIQYLLQI